MSVSPQQLREIVRHLSEDFPRHKELEMRLGEGVGFGRAWYPSQKEHWLGWLGEYDGPGAYGRQADKARDAQYVWNHIQCAPMLLWLAEALDLPGVQLERAMSRCSSPRFRGAARCAALRSEIPWHDIEAALPRPSLSARVRHLLTPR